jgi:hypothetical protein
LSVPTSTVGEAVRKKFRKDYLGSREFHGLNLLALHPCSGKPIGQHQTEEQDDQ